MSVHDTNTRDPPPAHLRSFVLPLGVYTRQRGGRTYTRATRPCPPRGHIPTLCTPSDVSRAVDIDGRKIATRSRATRAREPRRTSAGRSIAAASASRAHRGIVRAASGALAHRSICPPEAAWTRQQSVGRQGDANSQSSAGQRVARHRSSKGWSARRGTASYRALPLTEEPHIVVARGST